MLFLWMWLAFWILMFLLGLQEYLWAGGRHVLEPAVEYGTAALISTFIGVMQLRRAPQIDRFLGRPALWLMHLWKWMPLETLGFAIIIYAIPRAVNASTGGRSDGDDWLEQEIYDTGKFLLFYFLAGGIQFGIHTYKAWTTERLRVAEHARLAQEAQLTQLTQQLQPHFLFNGLNTVASLIHSDPDLADLLLGQLATLLRAATSASRCSEQTLEEELVLLRAYAAIMTRRFGDRVRVDWAIDDDALDCLVPTLGLQPLLENCFQHVVERRWEPTRIVVRARRCAAGLCVEIEDDGEAQRALPVHGVGLGNLRRRLESLHGAEARLALVPGRSSGLTVRVELPCAS